MPAALALLLALALMFQLMLPVQVDLPDVAARPMKALDLRPAPTPPASVPPALAARNVFAPGGGGGKNATGDAGAVTLLGVARSGRTGAAVLRGPDGATMTVPLGGRIGPWRVTGIGIATARIDNGARSMILRVGETASQPTAVQSPEGNGE